MSEPTDNQEIEAAELASRQTADRWHLHQYSEPRKVLLHMLGIGKGKALVEFHGNLEIVDAADLYETEEACMTGAWLLSMERAQTHMEAASRFRARADKLRKEAGK